MRFSSFITVY